VQFGPTPKYSAINIQCVVSNKYNLKHLHVTTAVGHIHAIAAISVGSLAVIIQIQIQIQITLPKPVLLLGPT